MAIEWDETVETKRRVALVVDLNPSDPFDAPDEVRSATIDDLRRACAAVGGYQFHDWEAVHAICDEHGVSRETMGLDAQMMRPALARERVRELVVKLSEKEERYYQDALTAEAERNACLDALSEHVSPDATADTPRMVRPSSVLAGIRSLQGRLRDARSDLREHDAALEAAVERRSEEADASTELARAILNAVPGEDIVSAARRTMASLARSVEKGEALREHVRTLEADLAAARARIAELEAPMPEATVEELERVGEAAYTEAWNRSCLDSRRAVIRAVAERVRRVRPQCLIARAVAANIDVRVAEDLGGGFLVAAHRAGEDEHVEHTIPAAEVPAELARMLTEVGA